MFSVNQMAIYHSLLETFNIKRKSASDQIRMKWEDQQVNTYFFRSSSQNNLKIPEKPAKRCTGFTYSGAKLFNILPGEIKKCLNSNKFKSMIKNWIWQEIPSYQFFRKLSFFDYRFIFHSHLDYCCLSPSNKSLLYFWTKQICYYYCIGISSLI